MVDLVIFEEHSLLLEDAFPVWIVQMPSENAAIVVLESFSVNNLKGIEVNLTYPSQGIILNPLSLVNSSIENERLT
jgi:hypothetical protein